MSNTDDRKNIEEIKVNGRNVVRGTELSFNNVRGRFRFMYAVENPNGSIAWLTVYGGTGGRKQYHSFALDRVRSVHYKTKMRT